MPYTADDFLMVIASLKISIRLLQNFLELLHTELRHNFCAETARQTSQELNKILQEAQ
jgi:hypothetical protein